MLESHPRTILLVDLISRDGDAKHYVIAIIVLFSVITVAYSNKATVLDPFHNERYIGRMSIFPLDYIAFCVFCVIVGIYVRRRFRDRSPHSFQRTRE